MSADFEAQLAQVTAERDDLLKRWQDLNVGLATGRGAFAGGKAAWQSQRAWAQWAPIFDVFTQVLDGIQVHVDAALKAGGK